MRLPISERLLACCNFVCKGDRVADIGCDHGYLGIHLITNGIASHVMEADVAIGPLESARRNAMKYQEESTNVSIVSVSRLASAPHTGHLQFKNSSHLFYGLPEPSGIKSVGKTTGRSFSGTGTGPQCGQWMIGIGVPQYR